MESARPPAVSPPRWHLVVLACAIGVNLVVAVAPRFFPYGDAPNHLARYVLINKAWDHTAPAWVTFHWLATGYIALDVVGALLVRLTSAITALRLMVIAYVVLLPLGMLALLRAVNPRTSAWALVACLLTFNWYFLEGFLSYSIGIGLSLFWLAWWWPRRDDLGAVTLICGALGVGLLYLVHMSAAAVALTAAGVACLEPLQHRSADSGIARWRRTRRRIVAAAAYAFPVLLLHLLMKWSSAFPATAENVAFRESGDKLRHLLTPFASFSTVEAVLFTAMYAVALGLRFGPRRSSPRSSPLRSSWVAVSVALLLLYLVFPVLLFRAWDVDVRFLLPAYLVVFVDTSHARFRTPGRRTVLAITSFVILQAGVTSWYASRIDRREQAFMDVVSLVPAHSDALVLASDQGDFFRVDPFMHIGEWLTIADPRVRVNGLFAGGTNGAYLGHFLLSNQTYDPGGQWAREGFPHLNWSRAQRDYSYIVIEGNDSVGMSRIAEGATLVGGNTNGSVYRIRTPPSGGSTGAR